MRKFNQNTNTFIMLTHWGITKLQVSETLWSSLKSINSGWNVHQILPILDSFKNGNLAYKDD